MAKPVLFLLIESSPRLGRECLSQPSTKAEILKESLPRTLYDLVRAEQFVPFSILFATGLNALRGPQGLNPLWLSLLPRRGVEAGVGR